MSWLMQSDDPCSCSANQCQEIFSACVSLAEKSYSGDSVLLAMGTAMLPVFDQAHSP
jgi:hypothetical protein